MSDNNNFSHQVEFSDDDNEIVIYRVFSDGRKQLFTKAQFPTEDLGKDKSAFENFAKTLGENLLIDSPVARAKFNI